MTDDWSLKSRVIKNRITGGKYVHVYNIETLRKKLIEDFTGLGMPPLPKEEVEKIINKRFGHDWNTNTRSHLWLNRKNKEKEI